MPPDASELSILSQQLASDAPLASETARDAIVNAVVGAALPFGIGNAITGLMNGEADRRWKERVVTLMMLFTRYLTDKEAAQVNTEYFGSEEFQALLVEAIEQERTNHHEEKRQMLAMGLANSGTHEFIGDEEKQLFFRVMRDLTPMDIRVLGDLCAQTVGHERRRIGCWPIAREQTLPQRNVTPTLNRLQGLGLVAIRQKLDAPNMSGVGSIQTQGELNQFIARSMAAFGEVVLQTTNFGIRFLKFLVGEIDHGFPNEP